MRDNLALASMLCSVPYIEQPALDGNESVVVFSKKWSAAFYIELRVTYAFKKPFP